jgi:hypothetical protein
LVSEGRAASEIPLARRSLSLYRHDPRLPA